MLDKGRKKEAGDLIYEYKNAFSLRDEIGKCPNIEVEIDVTDKTLFFIRPFHAKEEGKVILDKEMNNAVKVCYLGILKGFSAYSSPVMLNSRKMMKDKRVVTGFRHLNMHIAKEQLSISTIEKYFYIVE